MAVTEDRLLDGRVRVRQDSDGYRAGMDAALLAAACDAKPRQRVIEAGCGAGAVLLAAALRRSETHFTGVERDEAAVVLAGVERGIALGLDPGPPVTGNGYAVLAQTTRLPPTWHEAIERAAGSAFLADALGEGFLKIYLAIKRQECARFSAEVTELDRSWYLHSA